MSDSQGTTTPEQPGVGSGRKALITLFLIGGGVALLAVIGTFIASRNASTSSTPTDLTNTTWTTTTMTVNGTEQALASNSTMTMQFGDGRVSVNAGCNQQNGQATWTNGQIILSGPMASTMMACEQALMNQDQTIAAFLAGNPTYTQSGNTLTLTDGSMSVTLTKS